MDISGRLPPNKEFVPQVAKGPDNMSEGEWRGCRQKLRDRAAEAGGMLANVPHRLTIGVPHEQREMPEVRIGQFCHPGRLPPMRRHTEKPRDRYARGTDGGATGNCVR